MGQSVRLYRTKSWFPYEWFDTPDKLAEWKQCKRFFKEKGMQTFADWLRHYNNLDVAPGLEALVKMRGFYTAKGIGIFKDAVSIPGVSMQYLLRGTVERGAELWTPNDEEYEMLKGAVVGEPSLVFMRHHKAGVTHICPHQIANSEPCRKDLGYNANALYLSTMRQDMSCGKGQDVCFDDLAGAAVDFMQKVNNDSWLGFD